jgi:hypothetical protein
MDEALQWQEEVKEAHSRLFGSGIHQRTIVREPLPGSRQLDDALETSYMRMCGGQWYNLETFKWAVAAVESRAFGFKVNIRFWQPWGGARCWQLLAATTTWRAQLIDTMWRS